MMLSVERAQVSVTAVSVRSDGTGVPGVDGGMASPGGIVIFKEALFEKLPAASRAFTKKLYVRDGNSPVMSMTFVVLVNDVTMSVKICRMLYWVTPTLSVDGFQ